MSDGAKASRRAPAFIGAAGPPVMGFILDARAIPVRANQLRVPSVTART
jgi:hypothetical protein